jgi:hypothetical protein
VAFDVVIVVAGAGPGDRLRAADAVALDIVVVVVRAGPGHGVAGDVVVVVRTGAGDRPGPGDRVALDVVVLEARPGDRVALDVVVLEARPGHGAGAADGVTLDVVVGLGVVDVAHGVSFRRAENCGLLRRSACPSMALPAVVLPTEVLSYT